MSATLAAVCLSAVSDESVHLERLRLREGDHAAPAAHLDPALGRLLVDSALPAASRVAAQHTARAALRVSLLGKPWSECSTIVSTLTTGSKILVYGDIKAAYKIVDRAGLSVEPVPVVMGANQWPLGTRGLYAWWRVGAAVLVDNAARVLKTG